MKLVNFLKRMINEEVTVDTKDNLKVKGVITKIDRHSNIYLKDILIGDTKIEKFTIKGSNVRYIQFREDLPVESLFKLKV